MPKKPENELTKDEERLLIIAAKMYATIQEHTVCPPVMEEHKAYWLEKLTEEMHTVETIYDKYVNSNKPPRLHPAGQHVGHEWTEARKSDRPFCWEAITVNAITHGCKQQHSNTLNIKRHPDLSAIDISTYLREIAQKHWWWTHPPPPVAALVEDIDDEREKLKEKEVEEDDDEERQTGKEGKLKQDSGLKKTRMRDEEAGADADEDTPHKADQVSVVPHIEIDHASPPPCKIPKVIHTSFDEEPSTVACESCAIKKKKCNPIADWPKPVPNYALYPIQECLDMMEWHFTKLIHLNVAMAGILQVDASTIEAVTAPYTHSTASTRSSTRSDNTGGWVTCSAGERSVGPRGRTTCRQLGEKA
ncbi:hypothetical protein V8E53_013086 [Lactarius tabidus]